MCWAALRAKKARIMDDDDTSGDLVSGLAGLGGLSGATAVTPTATAATPAAVAAPPAAPAAAPGTLSALGDVPSALAALYQQQRQNTQNAYDQQAAALQAARKAQNGLSAADLFKLSGAMLTPTRGGSFAAALGNTLPVAGDIATAHEAAAKDYPSQMMALNQKYAADQLANTAGYISSATPTLKALNTAQMAANKAAQPKMQLGQDNYWHVAPKVDSQGRYVINSREEAEQVPAGEKFVLKDDPTGTTYYGKR